MANEHIHLRFVEYSNDLGHVAVAIARTFAVSHIDRAAGPRNFVGYQNGGRYWAAYWTAKRAVVVRELGKVAK